MIAEGGTGVAEVADDVIYFAIAVRNVGSGIAERGGSEHPPFTVGRHWNVDRPDPC